LSPRPDRPRPGTCDLAVLVNEFPKLSETFVISDLLALEARGVRLHLFAMRQPPSDLAPASLGQLRATVEYLPEIKGRQHELLMRATHLALFTRGPRRYARGLAAIYASPDYTRSRLQQAVLLARRLDQLACPALYIHFAHKPATVGRFAALLTGTPFAISAHAVDLWTSPSAELRAKFADARAVMCCYREALEFVSGLVDGRTRVELAPHGVVIPPDVRREEVSPPVLLAVGRLVEKKGLDTLIRAAAILREAEAHFQLRIAGEGPLWAALQRLVNELELVETVRFLGPLTEPELEEQYAQATAFVLPCQIGVDGNRDGLPNTLLEAMARGLPVVSTTLESVREAVTDGEHGLLVPPVDAPALAAALGELLRDPDMRNRLGSAARARVAEDYDRAALDSRVFEALIGTGLIQPAGH